MKTVFVIGAGASVEFGFPTGPGLQDRIVKLLQADDLEGFALNQHLTQIWDRVAGQGVNLGTFIDTCRWMASALHLSSSIDSFLEAHSEKDPIIGMIGKYSIASVIGGCEDSSPLQERDGIFSAPAVVNNSWFVEFWRRTTRGVSVKNRDSCMKDYSFVTFNYDRCLENFLRHAYRVHFRAETDEATKFVDSVDIVHVYGSLGPLSGETEFGNISYPPVAMRASSSIKTYSEQVDEEVGGRAGAIFDAADRVIFLGFSFSPINTNFIKSVLDQKGNLKQVYGTCLGMSSFDRAAAINWADRSFRQNHNGTKLDDLTAKQFFEHHNLMF